jgi:hypothetical protein
VLGSSGVKSVCITSRHDISASYNDSVSEASNERSGGSDREPNERVVIGCRNLERSEDRYVSRPWKESSASS